MATVLGLHGPAGSGKDTIGDYLTERYGWTKIAYARNLKEMCKKVFNLTDDDLETREGKRRLFEKPLVVTSEKISGILIWMSRTHARRKVALGAREKISSLIGTELESPRRVIQFVGTEICRSLMPSYHLDIVAAQINSNSDNKYIVTDIRFPNEGDLITDYFGGKVVFVDAGSRIESVIDKEHSSETSMRDWGKFSCSVDNTADDTAVLFKEVDKLLEKEGLL